MSVKVFTVFETEVFLILNIDSRFSFPIPCLSQRDGRWGCHVEPTEDAVKKTIKAMKKMRHCRPHLYPTTKGNVYLKIEFTEMEKLAKRGMEPTPDGFFYDCKFHKARGLWESVFVAWDKVTFATRAEG
ncbi:hypothetical protein LCGC14_1356540 [marine sediment metagenome]|uniref:Uncharacterized protein n=1 Tax=marine sediment metagenome TaxID=412755 RepID=A0A0F9KVH7_9ZZZZ